MEIGALRKVLALGFALVLPSLCWAAPILYSQPAYQSPIRAEPDDLLFLAGDGLAATDTVVYQRLADTTLPLTAPASIPTKSTAATGVAVIANSAEAPRGLAVRLPPVLQGGRSYALWVRSQDGQWSNGVKINDARPLWITPVYTYVNSTVASLPREIKVVGRNLQRRTGYKTRIKLIGSSTFILDATESAPGTTIDHYVARAVLPSSMPAGAYAVQVTRDGGISWVALNGQTFTVKPDPAPIATFSVNNYGCSPNDGLDDTACVLSAIAAARSAGGGSITFGAGTWNMANSSTSGVTYDGILVPQGVDLIGAGNDATTIVRGANWATTRATFTLQGRNTVRAIRFADEHVYQSTDSAASMLQLGVVWYRAVLYRVDDPTSVADVVISNNVFDKPFFAIGAGGLPIDRLFLTYNDIGAFNTGFFPGGDSNNTTYPFRIADSVVSYNTFKPGSYYSPPTQGAIASQVGAGYRVDFSNNLADGTSTQYLYNPSTEPKGWRAAFFWHMNDNHEMLLVSQNTMLCPGDRAGDGEAIAYDNNHNSFGLATPQPVIGASANTVTVNGPLLSRPAGYYVGHWVQVVRGPGLGQARKIVSYVADAAGSPVTITVAPAWDVAPQPSDTEIAIGRQFWQTYTVDNFIDQRQPLCQKSNIYRPKGGVITHYAQTVDSAIEGNIQHDSDGIAIAQVYSPTGTGTYGTMLEYFVEVRGNIIDQEYQYASECSMSGINLGYGATPDAPPPVSGFGQSISHNIITQADGLRGGAIGLTRGWFAGPPPNDWQFISGTLIFNNVINDMTPPVPPAGSCDGNLKKRSAIHMFDALAWRTTLYGNSCNNVAVAVDDSGTQTHRHCPNASLENSCECIAYIQSAYATPQTPQTAVGVTFSDPQLAGNLNVVVVGWSDSSSHVLSVTDSSGNIYQLAAGPTIQAGVQTQAIYYAVNSTSAGAGGNTVTVAFDNAALQPDVRIAEYSGVDPVNPFAGAAASVGNSRTSSAGSLTTTETNTLLIAANTAQTSTSTAGAEYVQRVITSPNGNILEDTIAAAPGSYSATARLTERSNWIMQVAAFRPKE